MESVNVNVTNTGKDFFYEKEVITPLNDENVTMLPNAPIKSGRDLDFGGPTPLTGFNETNIRQDIGEKETPTLVREEKTVTEPAVRHGKLCVMVFPVIKI